MPDLSLLVVLLLVGGPSALTWAITRNYFVNRHAAITDALEWLVEAASDEDAHGLDAALAHADTLIDRDAP
ncbi:hypothetical protein ACIBEJ_34505 [Nonomuraea sp. NPDC050790]|uniref:hypothetical protein n=1 Tax=Nonomuraea sp. NPDC050790 TaxID=3364371 RepID=UPI00378D30A3